MYRLTRVTLSAGLVLGGALLAITPTRAGIQSAPLQLTKLRTIVESQAVSGPTVTTSALVQPNVETGYRAPIGLPDDGGTGPPVRNPGGRGNGSGDDPERTTSPVPEPETVGLFAMGLLALSAAMRGTRGRKPSTSAKV